MAISSMTGFARADGNAEGAAFAWELRSVNGRGLDVRLRMAPGFEHLEIAARELIAKALTRGSVTAMLSLEKRAATQNVRLNADVLKDVLAAADQAIVIVGGQRPTVAELLSMKGVLEAGENETDTDEKKAVRDAAVLANLKSAIDGLVAARRNEGDRIAATLSGQITSIDAITQDVRSSPSRTRDAIQARLKDQISRLTATSDGFDAERLHQEAVLLATKVDVEEELARLEAHVAAANDILRETGSVGRKLDFLAQEFNREANTLCSKANAVDITRLGLALKTVIDQFREQVQNVE